MNRYSDNNDDEDFHHHRRRTSPTNYRGGGGGGRRAFDSPPRHHPGGGGGGFRQMSGGGGGGGFRPVSAGGGGGGFGSNYLGLPPQPPLSGQKRGFPFSSRGGSPDRFDGGSFAKLFVGSVPRTAREEDIRPLFQEHGRVIEVALIKDKRTGQQQGCCFVKYATSEEADRAIRALHNQHTLPGGVGPIQVRYADGERERLGAVEYKLFVGSLNKQATETEVEEIFSQYGRVEDVYLMRDEYKHSRGCGFVKYSHREMALAAINNLNGVYTMRGCDQPLTVRFADPKRPRPGESRDGGTPAFGGPGVGPRFQAPGPSHHSCRPANNFGDPAGDRVPPNAWHPISPPVLGSSSNPGIRGFGNQMPPRSGDSAMPTNLGGPLGGFSGPSNCPLPGLAVSSSSTSQQNFNQPLSQVPSVGQQISPLQKPVESPQHLPPSLQLQPQAPSSFSQSQTSHVGHLQTPVPIGQKPFSQALPSQHLSGFGGQLPATQPQLQHNASSVTALQTPLNINLQPNPVSAATNQPQLPAPVQQQLLQPLQQSPSQLAQLLSQQTQTLQASFQSSQQAFSQLQQQLQLMQPPNQSLISQQNSHATKQQWTGNALQTVASTPATTPATDLPSTTGVSAGPVATQTVAPVKCTWTEHTSPDGYKYYYNSVIGESRWEKPEELALFEQQQQQLKPTVQQPQMQSHSQVLPTQQVPQPQQVQLHAQLQTQLHNQPQLQQSFFPSPYSASGISGQNVQEFGRAHLPVAATSGNDPARFQQLQGLQASQELMWKNKPSGT